MTTSARVPRGGGEEDCYAAAEVKGQTRSTKVFFFFSLYASSTFPRRGGYVIIEYLYGFATYVGIICITTFELYNM